MTFTHYFKFKIVLMSVLIYLYSGKFVWVGFRLINIHMPCSYAVVKIMRLFRISIVADFRYEWISSDVVFILGSRKS